MKRNSVSCYMDVTFEGVKGSLLLSENRVAFQSEPKSKEWHWSTFEQIIMQEKTDHSPCSVKLTRKKKGDIPVVFSFQCCQAMKAANVACRQKLRKSKATEASSSESKENSHSPAKEEEKVVDPRAARRASREKEGPRRVYVGRVGERSPGKLCKGQDPSGVAFFSV